MAGAGRWSGADHGRPEEGAKQRVGKHDDAKQLS